MHCVWRLKAGGPPTQSIPVETNLPTITRGKVCYKYPKVEVPSILPFVGDKTFYVTRPDPSSSSNIKRFAYVASMFTDNKISALTRKPNGIISLILYALKLFVLRGLTLDSV